MHKGTKKRVYTREFRESAVRLVTADGVSPAKAAADLGMPCGASDSRTAFTKKGRAGP